MDVQVIDMGMDVSHEDLQCHLRLNKGEVPGNRLDDYGNGFIDDVNGNFTDNRLDVLGGMRTDH